MVRKITKWYVLLPYLNDYGKHLLLSDFEKELKKPHQTIKKYIQLLIKERILEEESKDKHTTYKLNLENALTFEHLSIAEKVKLTEFMNKSALLRRMYEILSEFFSGNSFLIFGSFARNLKGRDIDLLIIGKTNNTLEKKLKEFRDTYGIEIHKIEIENLNDLDKTTKIEIMNKHIILSNSDIFIRFFSEMYGKI
jgi:predicted nucleotidyltransferase